MIEGFILFLLDKTQNVFKSKTLYMECNACITESKMTHQPIKICSKDYDDTIKLDVSCIDKCNYNCKYCFNMKGNYVRTEKELNLDKVLEFSLWLNEKTGKKINISLVGGEPTLHSQFSSFAQMTNTRNDVITMTSFTNFAKPYEFFE